MLSQVMSLIDADEPRARGGGTTLRTCRQRRRNRGVWPPILNRPRTLAAVHHLHMTHQALILDVGGVLTTPCSAASGSSASRRAWTWTTSARPSAIC